MCPFENLLKSLFREEKLILWSCSVSSLSSSDHKKDEEVGNGKFKGQNWKKALDKVGRA